MSVIINRYTRTPLVCILSVSGEYTPAEKVECKCRRQGCHVKWREALTDTHSNYAFVHVTFAFLCLFVRSVFVPVFMFLCVSLCVRVSFIPVQYVTVCEVHVLCVQCD